jgi:hypothetical protein
MTEASGEALWPQGGQRLAQAAVGRLPRPGFPCPLLSLGEILVAWPPHGSPSSSLDPIRPHPAPLWSQGKPTGTPPSPGLRLIKIQPERGTEALALWMAQGGAPAPRAWPTDGASLLTYLAVSSRLAG